MKSPRAIISLWLLPWLAAGWAFPLQAAPAAAEQAETGGQQPCLLDTARYCREAPEPGVCLNDNWGRLSQACRDATGEGKNNPCWDLIRRRCWKVGPNTSLYECLWENLAEAAPSCVTHVKDLQIRNPCTAPKERFCKSAKPGEETALCLVDRSDSLPAACLEKLLWSPHWPRPCEPERKRFCRDMEKERSRLTMMECLADFMDQLSPRCQKVVKRIGTIASLSSACAADSATFCKNTPKDEMPPCLLRNQDKVSLKCRLKLRNTQPGAAPKGR